ncbi:MAG: FKBP-type peptidyl-prolyl cis-trans isomerase [Calditrichota bacterium]
MTRIFSLFLAVVLLLVLTGCGGSKAKPAEAKKETIEKTTPIQQIEESKLKAELENPVTTKTDTITSPSGLKYVDLVVGNGASPQAGQICVMHYTGWLLDGKKFDSSLDRNQPFKFPLGQKRVIAGWEEGVASMKIGGKRKLIIPPELGYGAREVGGGLIPANSTLIFDVELLGVEAPSTPAAPQK